MTTAPFENETTSLVGKRHKPNRNTQVWNIVWCLVGAAIGMLLMGYSRATSPSSSVRSVQPPKISPYSKVQGLGFQMYTGGAPAFLNKRATIRNPECMDGRTHGSNDDSNVVECYLGDKDPMKDVQ